jgi:ABC-type sugar transport system permease subunit
MTMRRRRTLIAMAFIAVPVVSSIVFLYGPMVVSAWWSLTEYNGIEPAKFVGLDNYVKLFTNDAVFLKALRNTTAFTFFGMLIGPTLGLLTALMLNQKVRLQSFFRTAYFLPVMTSLVVTATIWRMLLNRNGLLNDFLAIFGVGPIGWLSDPHFALPSIIVASVWQGFGFETVIFLAALQAIPRDLYDAAAVDGASSLQQFRHVTLPQLRPVLIFVYIVGIIGSFQVFDQVYVMTGGGPVNSTTTLVLYLYSRFMNLRLGYASAIAYILFAILAVFSFLQWWLFRERD